MGDWESGKTEPRQPKRAAYALLLKGLAARFSAPAAGSAPTAPEPSPPAQPTPTRTPPRARAIPPSGVRSGPGRPPHRTRPSDSPRPRLGGPVRTDHPHRGARTRWHGWRGRPGPPPPPRRPPCRGPALRPRPAGGRGCRGRPGLGVLRRRPDPGHPGQVPAVPGGVDSGRGAAGRTAAEPQRQGRRPPFWCSRTRPRCPSALRPG